jgi:hypothetical protein
MDSLRLRLLLLKTKYKQSAQRLKHGNHDQRRHGAWAEGMGGPSTGGSSGGGRSAGMAGGIQGLIQRIDAANRRKKPKVDDSQLSLWDENFIEPNNKIIPIVDTADTTIDEVSLDMDTDDLLDDTLSIRDRSQLTYQKTDDFANNVVSEIKNADFTDLMGDNNSSDELKMDFIIKNGKAFLNSLLPDGVDADSWMSLDFDLDATFSNPNHVAIANIIRKVKAYSDFIEEQASGILETINEKVEEIQMKKSQISSMQVEISSRKLNVKNKIIALVQKEISKLDLDEDMNNEQRDFYDIYRTHGALIVNKEKLRTLESQLQNIDSQMREQERIINSPGLSNNNDYFQALMEKRTLTQRFADVESEISHANRRITILSKQLDAQIEIARANGSQRIEKILSDNEVSDMEDMIKVLRSETDEQSFYVDFLSSMARQDSAKKIGIQVTEGVRNFIGSDEVNKLNDIIVYSLSMIPNYNTHLKEMDVGIAITKARKDRSQVRHYPSLYYSEYLTERLYKYEVGTPHTSRTMAHEVMHIVQDFAGEYLMGHFKEWIDEKTKNQTITNLNKLLPYHGYNSDEMAVSNDTVKHPYLLKFYEIPLNQKSPRYYTFKEIPSMIMDSLIEGSTDNPRANDELFPLMMKALLTLPSDASNANVMLSMAKIWKKTREL